MYLVWSVNYRFVLCEQNIFPRANHGTSVFQFTELSVSFTKYLKKQFKYFKLLKITLFSQTIFDVIL